MVSVNSAILISFCGLLVSFVGLLFSIFFNSKSAKKTDREDVEERVRHETKVDLKLDEIYRVSSETKNIINTIQTEVREQGEKIAKIDESVKSAHKRIDTILKLGGNAENE